MNSNKLIGNSFFTVLFSAIIAAFFALLLLLGLSISYIVGILGIFLLVQVFIRKPINFLFTLLFLWPAFGTSLLSIRFSVLGTNFGLWGMISFALIIFTLFYSLVQKNDLKIISQPMAILLLLFFIVNVISFFFSQDKGEAAKVLLRYASIFSILILAFRLVKNESDAYLLLKGIIFSAVVPLVIFVKGKGLQEGRLISTLGHSNIYAFFLLFIICCVLFGICNKKTEFSYSIWEKLYFLLLIISLILTQTRSAWFAFFLIIILLSFYFNKKLIPGIIICGLIFFSLPFVQERMARVFSFDHGISLSSSVHNSFRDRIDHWGYLLAEGFKRPFIGYGINAADSLGRVRMEAHNDYVRFFVESGFLGLVTYFAPYFYLFVTVIRRNRNNIPSELMRKITHFFMCFIPAFFLMSFSENLARYVMVYWDVWAIVAIYLKLDLLNQRNSQFKVQI